MEARARLLGHPVHQMLIVIPLGLLTTAVIFDLVHFFGDQPRFADAAFLMICAGIIGGLVAAVFGIVDWSAIPRGSRARRTGLLHAGVNVVALALFAAGVALRWDNPDEPSGLALLASVAGLVVATVGGWLGGELVNRMGVGVHDGANVNAPSSLERGDIPVDRDRTLSTHAGAAPATPVGAGGAPRTHVG